MMDIATIIGFLAAFGVVIIAILWEGQLSQIYDLPAILIVFGGSAGVVMMKYSISQFLSALNIAGHTIVKKTETKMDLMKKIMEISDSARKNGMLSLENIKTSNAFLKQGMQYLTDGIEPDLIEQTLYNQMILTQERHQQGQQIFRGLGEVAPAMGMIGTLIGLVQMLSHMSDPKAIGPGMAVAMLTTFYGAVMANMIALPIAEKLEIRCREDRNTMAMIIDAILAIQQGQNPRIIRDLLKPYLPGHLQSHEIALKQDKYA